MSDRVRTGEILAAIGAVGLAVLLAFGVWFKYGVTLPDGRFALTGGVGASHLGWFALAVTIFAAIAGLLALVRILTAPTTERIMLQLPVAYATALFALVVDLVRMLIFTPDVTITIADPAIAQRVGVRAIETSGSVAGGGWLGLAALFLLVIGTWIAMADDRTDAAGTRARTEAILAATPPRPAPPADGAPGTTPIPPTTPATGESA